MLHEQPSATGAASFGYVLHHQFHNGTTVSDMVARLRRSSAKEIKTLQEKEGVTIPDCPDCCVWAAEATLRRPSPLHRRRTDSDRLGQKRWQGIEKRNDWRHHSIWVIGNHPWCARSWSNEDGQVKSLTLYLHGLDYPSIGPMHANLTPPTKTGVVVLAISDDDKPSVPLHGLAWPSWKESFPALESACFGALDKPGLQTRNVVVLTVSGRNKDINLFGINLFTPQITD